jgi:hypothetical protein
LVTSKDRKDLTEVAILTPMPPNSHENVITEWRIGFKTHLDAKVPLTRL